MTLSTLKCGQEAEIQAVRGPRALAHRLRELGVLPGTRVTLVRRAPGGAPIEVRLRGYGLSLRKNEADMIYVAGA